MPNYEETELSSAEAELIDKIAEPESKPKKSKPESKSKSESKPGKGSWKDRLSDSLPCKIGDYEVESWNRWSGTTYAILKSGGSVAISTLRDILQSE